MELPGGIRLDRNLFSDLKHRMGFGRSSSEEHFDEGYPDDYRDYIDGGELGGYEDDYGEYGYSDEYRTPSSSYSSVRSGAGTTPPRLVSIDDVRATTPVPGSPRDREARAQRAARSSYSSGRTMVDSSLPPAMTPEGTAAFSASATAAANRYKNEASRSENGRRGGLDSLFSSTSDDDNRRESENADVLPASSPKAKASFKPLNSSPRRSLFILEPKAYGEAEQIVDALDRNEVVVLNLRETPDNLARRILDFSFGVACALDAGVDFIDDDVFTVCHGSPLNDAERTSLHTKGIL